MLRDLERNAILAWLREDDPARRADPGRRAHRV